MSDSLLEEEEEEDVGFGRSTSANVYFSGPGLHSLQGHLVPAQEGEAQAAAADGAASLRELGEEAVWSLSSAKMGNGVEQIRDNDVNTFWQSDGLLPHVVTIQFHRKTRVSCVCLYVDHKMDESYTPSKIAIRVGSGAPAGASATGAGGAVEVAEGGEVKEVDRFEMESATGWVIVQLRQAPEQSAWGGEAEQQSAVRCHFVQIVILNSYQNGRDCHLRQVKVFGPRNWSNRGVVDDLGSMSTVTFRQHAQIR